MPRIYSARVTASYEANSDNLALEITAPAGTSLKIRKIRIMADDGTSTTTPDYHKKVKLVRESAGGTGGTSYTPIDLDAISAASAATVKTGLTTVGTISETIDVLSIHSATDFYWQAYDEDDMITIAAGGIFGIVVNPAA